MALLFLWLLGAWLWPEAAARRLRLTYGRGQDGEHYRKQTPCPMMSRVSGSNHACSPSISEKLINELGFGQFENFFITCNSKHPNNYSKKENHFCQVGAKSSFRMLQIMKDLHFPAEVLGAQRQKVTSPQPLRSQETSEMKMHCKTLSPEASPITCCVTSRNSLALSGPQSSSEKCKGTCWK